MSNFRSNRASKQKRTKMSREISEEVSISKRIRAVQSGNLRFQDDMAKFDGHSTPHKKIRKNSTYGEVRRVPVEETPTWKNYHRSFAGNNFSKLHNLSKDGRIDFFEENGFDKSAKYDSDPSIRVMYYRNNMFDVGYRTDPNPIVRGICQSFHPEDHFGERDKDWYVNYAYERSH